MEEVKSTLRINLSSSFSPILIIRHDPKHRLTKKYSEKYYRSYRV